MNRLKSFSVCLLIFWFLLCPSGLSVAHLEITVYTDQPSYSLGDRVEIYGKVMLNNTAVENVMVALEVRDPQSSPVITRTMETNSSGIYDVFFTLPAEDSEGTYTVHVSCTHNSQEASNSSSFQVQHIPDLMLTVKTDNETYKPGETITVSGSVTYDGSPVQGTLVAVEVQDPKGTSLVIRVLETGEQGSYQTTFQLPLGCELGEYQVYASATHQDDEVTASTTFKLEVELITDIDGNGLVDILDIALVAKAWGTSPGDSRWDPRCDIDGNGEVNILDIARVALDYGRSVS